MSEDAEIAVNAKGEESKTKQVNQNNSKQSEPRARRWCTPAARAQTGSIPPSGARRASLAEVRAP